MSPNALIVDDDPVQRRLIGAALEKAGHRCAYADSGEAALKIVDGVDGGDIRVIILDLVMPGMGGIELLDRLREMQVFAPVIVLTSKGGIETVVTAMRHGAFDFTVKPVAPERLHKAVDAALKVGAVEGEQRRRASPAPTRGMSFRDLVTGAPVMERVLRLGQKAAASDIPILIEGESGVGKEVVARAIQGSGNRRTKPFVTVNCGAIPDNLVESILFGHEKGAFTGATEKHVGKFVEANGGTLFLDEIGELPLEVQVKLLRAVQSGEVDPVGGRATIRVDIRLISATNRDLLQQVKDGKFREDLFYRLNVFPIHVPPLRDRREDIPLLVQHFISRLGASAGTPRIRGISSAALRMLEAYDWPGNIRQLENAILRAAVLADGDVLTADEFPQIRAQLEGIDLSALDAPTVEPGAGEDVAEQAASLGVVITASAEATQPGMLSAIDERGDVRALADVEREMISLAIEHYNGQMSEVARRLGIGRSTLYRKLKEFGLDPETGRAQRVAS